MPRGEQRQKSTGAAEMAEGDGTAASGGTDTEDVVGVFSMWMGYRYDRCDIDMTSPLPLPLLLTP